MSVLNAFTWPHGLFIVHPWPTKQGIMGSWINGWDPLSREGRGYAAAVLLEDDLEVSRHYARWFLGAHATYTRNDPRLGAATGQRGELVAGEGEPGSLESHLAPGTKAFAYRLLGTWGFSPKATAWADFRAWFYALPEGFKPNVPGIIPDRWFNDFTRDRKERSMWEMWWIRFSHEKDLFTVYPWPNEGKHSITCNWREAGLHFDHSEGKCDFPLSTAWDPQLLEQAPLRFHDWNMHPITAPAETKGDSPGFLASDSK